MSEFPGGSFENMDSIEDQTPFEAAAVPEYVPGDGSVTEEQVVLGTKVESADRISGPSLDD